jgi:poly(3-hydroxybutyrate) depolymerase
MIATEARRGHNDHRCAAFRSAGTCQKSQVRMFKYIPAQPEPRLVVVLHGGTQTAASYDLGAGW